MISTPITTATADKSATRTAYSVQIRNAGYGSLREYWRATAFARLSEMAGDTAVWLEERGIVELGQCEHCESYRCSSDLIDAGGRRGALIICGDCRDGDAFFTCADCSEVFSRETYYGSDCEGDAVCEGCSESYFTCENCHSVCHSDNYGSDGCCSDCERSEEESDAIPEYHSQRRRYGCFGSEMRFGVELELKAYDSDDCLALYNRAMDAGFIAERDGSLHNTLGIEIVGPPLTLAENIARWMPFLDGIRSLCQGWNAGTGYGMHVSLNRQAMSAFQQGKLLVFIHGNKALCEYVAGRDEVHWAVYVPKKATSGKMVEGQKYEALSLRGSQRMEMRIFRSTTKPQGFLRNLQFAAASAFFAMQAGLNELTESAFRAWMEKPEQSKVFPDLWAHLNRAKADTRFARKELNGMRVNGKGAK